MLQATILDGDLFDPFPFFQNGLSSSEVDIRRREIVQALMRAFVVIVFDEDRDLHFEFPRQIVIVQEDPVFQCLMPTLDLTLRLRMIRRAADMIDFLVVQPFCEIARDVGGASYGRIWVTEPGQAARFSLASLVATPSMNFTPSMSRGN